MIVLDEHLQGLSLEPIIERWYRGRVRNIKQLRPGTVIKDDAIPQLLHSVKQPTFVTLNHTDFWRRVPASHHYCIVCLQLPTERVREMPSLLRRLFRLSGFSTKSTRMGKVVLASTDRLQVYQVPDEAIHSIAWP